MIIRPATHSDVERMDEICEAAKAAMRNMGIDQWQDGYPNRACWEADVDDGFAYVAETDEGTIAGMFALVTNAETRDPEPSYGKIDGAWLTSTASYAVVHRVGVARRAEASPARCSTSRATKPPRWGLSQSASTLMPTTNPCSVPSVKPDSSPAASSL